MDVRDIVRLGIIQLKEKKVRTALTIIMVIIGVASIVALTSQTAGTSASIQKSLGSLGPTAILVSPSGKTLLTSADVAEIETLPNVSSVTPIVTGSGTLTVDGENQSVTILGVSTNGLDEIMGNSTFLYQGALYSDNLTPSSDIGYSVAFSSTSEPDVQQIGANETGTLEVSGSSGGGFGGGGSSSSKIAIPISGVLDDHSTSLISVDDSVFFSLSYAEVLLDKDSYSEILVKANSASSVTALTSLLEVVYGDNARVTNTASLASTFSSITSSTTTLYIVIAGISLLVAAIGIMNVMLMSVSERIHDIGIFKSIGFESKDVLLIFMFQAVVIGLLGGVLGLGSGVLASYAISSAGGLHSTPTAAAPTSFTAGSGARTFGSDAGGFSGRGGGGTAFVSTAGGGAQFYSTSASAAPSTTTTSSTSVEPVFTLSVIAEAIAIAVVISMIAGIYPAWKASKMEPIDALRTL